MLTKLPIIAVSAGEPAGIGPDLCLLLSQAGLPARLVVIADGDMLAARARALHLDIVFQAYTQNAALPSRGTVEVVQRAAAHAVTPGQLDAANAPYVLACLERGVEGCLNGEFDALVTAPVQKSVINDAGIVFTGHTEWLAARMQVPVVMMLTGGGLRVAVATTHLPLAAVPAAITHESLDRTLRILDRDLREKFGIASPRILVAGLNPHSGESGYLGREEIEVIIPVLDALRAEGMQLTGPLPADTLFTPKYLQQADAVLAMYHDQGLAVLKYASFGEGVNVTLGLPIIRTSVDHGTALDLAATGKAESGSMVEAVRLAIELATKKMRQQ